MSVHTYVCIDMRVCTSGSNCMCVHCCYYCCPTTFGKCCELDKQNQHQPHSQQVS